MTSARIRTSLSQPVLAAYACVLAIVLGGAVGVGLAGLAAAQSTPAVHRIGAIADAPAAP